MIQHDTSDDTSEPFQHDTSDRQNSDAARFTGSNLLGNFAL
jgi:hypothetical protein